ncbi:MAG: hypothetical protein KC583_03620 [Myxococcales bacterium]|nr:hypothetical protein [Myxococcales bacterium]
MLAAGGPSAGCVDDEASPAPDGGAATRADLDAPPDALPVADRGPVDASAGAGSGARDCSAVTDCPVLDSEYSQSTCREPVRDCASYAVPCGSPYSELDVCGCIRQRCLADADCQAGSACNVSSLDGQTGYLAAYIDCYEEHGECVCSEGGGWGGVCVRGE